MSPLMRALPSGSSMLSYLVPLVALFAVSAQGSIVGADGEGHELLNIQWGLAENLETTHQVLTGTNVTWTWADDNVHCVTGVDSQDPLFKIGSPAHAGKGYMWTYRFDTPGVYSYRCCKYPDEMNGAIIVASNREARILAEPKEDIVACDKHVDNELLGLGIRCGIYMQWVALLVKELGAGGFGESVNHAMIVSVAHVLAVSVQVFREDYSHYTVSIVFWLILGILFSFTVPALISIAKWRTVVLRRAQMTVVTLGTLFADAFFVWYWSVGYKDETEFDCSTIYSFFFGKVDAFGWYRAVCLIQVLIHAVTTVYTYVSLMVILEKGEDTVLVQDRLKEKSESGWVRILEVKAKILALFGIITVEMALRYNDLKSDPVEMLETSQLIPLLIGVASLLSVATSLWKHTIKREELAAEGKVAYV